MDRRGHRIHLPQPRPYAGENLTVAFAERYARYVRLRVADSGAPPLGITSAEVAGRMRYVFFPVQAGKRYRLFYGNPRAGRPPYDYPNVFQGIDRETAIAAVLGNPMPNPLYVPPRAIDQTPPRTNRWVPYLILGLVAAGLTLLALRLLRGGGPCRPAAPPDPKRPARPIGRAFLGFRFSGGFATVKTRRGREKPCCISLTHQGFGL